MKTIFLGSAMLALALVPAAHAQDEDPIKIGFAIAQSGWMATYDDAPFKAAVLKIEEINAAGGLLGRQIEYSVLDTQTERERSATAGRELIQDGVDFLIVSGDYDFGAPAALAAQEAGILAFSTIAGDPKMGVQGIGEYAFTGMTAAQVEGMVMAEWGYKERGFRNVYILEDTLIEYNRSVCAGFRHSWEQLAGADSIVGSDTFVNDDPNIAPQVSRILALDTPPDAIFLCSVTPGGASAVREIRAANITAPILANTAMSDNYWLETVPNLKDFYVPALMSLYGDDPRESANQYVQAFEARWGEAPVTSYSIAGYSVIEQWARAVEKAGTTESDKVLEVLETFDGEEFTIGPTTFTSELHIQTKRPYLVMGVENGSFRSVELYSNEIEPTMNLLFRVGD